MTLCNTRSLEKWYYTVLFDDLVSIIVFNFANLDRNGRYIPVKLNPEHLDKTFVRSCLFL